jgi:hypothetical protein
LIEKYADKLLEVYGLLYFNEDKLVNKVKKLDEFIEIQNKNKNRILWKINSKK